MVASACLLAGCGGDSGSAKMTYAVTRGHLPITVTEGGSLEALEAQEIKSEVRGQTTILKIVDEGYRVTEEDVKNGKILVELDDSEIADRLTQQEISYQSALASFMDAKTSYEIQVKRNTSDIKSAQLQAKFARMDFEKYVGADLANAIIRDLGLDVREEEAFTMPDYGDPLQEVEAELNEKMAANAAAEADPGAGPGQGGRRGPGGMPSKEEMFAKLREVGIDPDEVKAEAGSPFPIDPQKLMKVAREKGIDLAQLRPGGGGGRPPQAPAETAPMEPDQDVTPGDEPVADVEIELAVDMPEIDFSSYINKLAAAEEGGEAQQKLRKFEDDLYLAQEELTLAEADLEGTKRLFDEDFVTEQELDADRMALERRKVSVKSQETGKDLFVRYEFPKQAEKLLSDYEEALGNLEQVKKQAVANLAKSSANLRSSEAKLELQRRERDRYQEQVENCKIAAERPGLVVYASGNNRWNNRRIEEGATVHQEQDILIIPDMTEMGVNLKIPEAAIQKVAEGQRARITMDAFPDRPIEGVVTKVSPVPDSGHRWMSPDQNVYATEIAIEEAHDWLKPGFTAQVEIMIETVEDVLYIPIHSVVAKGDDQVVYVANGGGDPERRTVKTGQFNEEYIVIAEGLEEGEEVLLAPPMSGDQGPVEEETPEEGGEMMAAQAN